MTDDDTRRALADHERRLADLERRLAELEDPGPPVDIEAWVEHALAQAFDETRPKALEQLLNGLQPRQVESPDQ